jgi:hypothetical protein
VEEATTKKGNTILASMEQIMIKGNKVLVGETNHDYKGTKF